MSNISRELNELMIIKQGLVRCSSCKTCSFDFKNTYESATVNTRKKRQVCNPENNIENTRCLDLRIPIEPFFYYDDDLTMIYIQSF